MAAVPRATPHRMSPFSVAAQSASADSRYNARPFCSRASGGGDTFVAGQRWLSEAEPDLGLGLVEEVDQRHVLVRFAASGQNGPMPHAMRPESCASGADDKVRDPQGRELTVVRVDERGRCWRITVSTTQGSCHCCRNSCWMTACNSIDPRTNCWQGASMQMSGSPCVINHGCSRRPCGGGRRSACRVRVSS